MNAPAQAALDPNLLVRDMTATPTSGPRTHEMIVNGVVESYEFKPGKALKLPRAIAVKFLIRAPEAFRLCDDKGNFIDWKGTPRQPGDLQAGERLRLTAEQTVANLSELTNEALWMRCVALPKGEAVAEANDRAAMIEFIVAETERRKRENTVDERDPDGYVPEAETDDIAA